MSKNFSNGTKIVQGNKKSAREQKTCKGTKTKNVPISQNDDRKGHMGAKCYVLWHIMVLNCCV